MKFLVSLSLSLLAFTAQAEVSAKAFIVMDMTGKVVKSQNADEERSIASITKLVTTERAAALAAEELITIEQEDIKLGRMRSTPLRVGVSYTRAELIELALVSSDNVAAMALGRTNSSENTPPNITIVEPSGLAVGNKGTARSLAEYARGLYNTSLAAVSVQEKAKVGVAERRSTNPLINKPGWDFYLSKTGFTRPAGGCLVVITRIGNELMTVVILGSSSARSRWRDLMELRRELHDEEFFTALKERKKRKAKKIVTKR